MSDNDGDPDGYRRDMSRFYLSEELSDMHIVLDDDSIIHAHKVIMFSGTDVENIMQRLSVSPDSALDIQFGVGPEIVKHALKYLYGMGLFKNNDGGDNETFGLDTYIEVQQFAGRLGIKGLKISILKAAKRRLEQALEDNDIEFITSGLRACHAQNDWLREGGFQDVAARFCRENLQVLQTCEEFDTLLKDVPQLAIGTLKVFGQQGR